MLGHSMEITATSHSPWSQPVDEVVGRLTPGGVASGLASAEAAARLAAFGANALGAPPQTPLWSLLLRQLKSLVVALLVAAAILSGVFGDWIECGAILAVIAVNTLIGFVTELRAVRSMDALRLLTEIMATVRRDGELARVNAKEIVPGDVIILEAGGIVPADVRLVETAQLQIDESALTGESVPVEKHSREVPVAVPLAERANMAYKSSPVTRGTGTGIAVATGMATEIGQISAMVAPGDDEDTPLDKRLDALAGRLVWVTLAVTVLTAAAGIWAGKGAYLMIQASIALAVAAIPEGLPVVATIALARGMWRMAHRNALINRLSAVETLGATSVICTDKTGTLTENRMTLVRVAVPGAEYELDGNNQFVPADEGSSPDGDRRLQHLLEVASLCNNASLDADGRGIGDPLEIALVSGADKAGIDRRELQLAHERVAEHAFDSDRKMMATRHSLEAGGWRIAVKGAAEPVLAACPGLDAEARAGWLEKNQAMAAGGLRVLAFANKTVREEHGEPYAGLSFAGLAGLLDPPREDVAASLAACRAAGIRVVMMTGDQAPTAANVARRVGLLDPGEEAVIVGTGEIGDVHALADEDRARLVRASIFSRVTPRQKLEIIGLHQQAGSIVAMTGDGVNDAPALRQADIGVAMGQRGTEVAKETADMILRDDRFSTIVEAVFQGRVIFANIRRFVVYLMSCNLSEILVIGFGAALAETLPLLPLQILFLNLVTDVFPALALGAGEGSPSIMRQPPRPSDERILRRLDWIRIVAFSILLALSVLGAHEIAAALLDFSDSQCITVAFLVLAFAQLWHVFNMADTAGILRNRYVWAALALCTALILGAFLVPPVASVMHLHAIGTGGWTLVIGASLVPLAIGSLAKCWRAFRANSGEATDN